MRRDIALKGIFSRTRVAERDLTQGSIVRNVWILAIPMILEQMTVSAFRLLDTFWVGKLGPAALAALTMSGTVVWTVNQVGMGLGVGGTAIVARRIGEKDEEGANKAVAQAILIAVLLSVILGTAGFLTSEQIVRLLGAEPEVVPLGTSYLRISFAGFFAIIFIYLINGLLRGAGNASAAMWALAIASATNMIVEPFLIFGLGPLPPLGVDGSALATLLSRGTGIAFQLYVLLTGRARIVIDLKQFRLDLRLMWTMIQIALPSIVQLTMRMAARVLVLGIVAMFGTIALAGYGIAQRLTLTVLIPAFGLANAATTLVGQNLGASQPKRAERSAWIVGAYNMALMGSAGILFLILAEPLVGLFSGDPAVIALGSVALRIMALAYVFNALGATMGRSLDGAGNTVPPMVINTLSLVVLQLGLAYGLSTFAGWGTNGIWTAMVLSTVTNALLMTIWFRRGRWKLRKV
ncbi:MAG: MATE family efflux transporter [Anaerolineae bacterium]